MAKPKPYYTVATLEPSSSIGFLVKRCGVLMTQFAERRFEALAISFTQWLVLASLSMRASHVSATQLSSELGHDMGALTRVVDDLERRGLVRRERSRRDRRAVEIAITPAGRRQAQDGKRVIVELLNRAVEPFTERERDRLIALLQRLHQHLQHSADTELQSARPGRTRRHRKTGADENVGESSRPGGESDPSGPRTADGRPTPGDAT